MGTTSRRRLEVTLFALIFFLLHVVSTSDESDAVCNSADTDTCTNRNSDDQVPMVPMPATCRLVMAQSSIPDAGWGLYTMVSLPRGVPLAFGDVVIQVPDLNHTHADGLSFLMHDYMWESQETGGQYEGVKVFSMVPGVGMLANGHSTQFNVLPYRPDVDEADLTRTKSPGVGAISHYHNFSFYVQRPVTSGTEIFLNYGKNWYAERNTKISHEEVDNTRSIAWLRENGICLDNLRPGKSTNSEAGRGAFATRHLMKGAVIAPFPLAPISKRSTLHLTKIRQADVPGKPDVVVEGRQLLLNYCLGHRNSSLLFYPYSPIVNLINHDSTRANAKLRWSTSYLNSGRGWLDWSLEDVKQLNRSGFLMELVALRNIAPREEVFIDYGETWENAWKEHVAKWEPPPFAEQYTPAYVMDDVASVLRTEAEQKSHPYPENLFTSCFYRFQDNSEKALSVEEARGTTTTFQWKMNRGIYEFENLRPCAVLQRGKAPDGTVLYTVRVRNRPALAPEERIPKGLMHVVTHVPRHALRFSDKLYTTDQHLENAFRHEIGIPDEIFPKQWMDLELVE